MRRAPHVPARSVGHAAHYTRATSLALEQILEPSGLRAQIGAGCTHMCAKLRCGVPRPAWVVEDGARDRDEIGVARPDDGFGLLELRDEPHCDHRHLDSLLDGARERHLIVWSDRNLLCRMQSAAGNVNGTAAELLDLSRECDGLFDVPSALDPIRAGYPDRDGFVGRESIAYRFEYFERKADAVFERAAIFVFASIRQRRDELMQQITVAHMQLDHVDAYPVCTTRGSNERLTDAAQSIAIQRDGCQIAVVVWHG